MPSSIGIKKYWLLAAIIATLLPALLPSAHIFVLYNFWHEFGRRVHRKYCSCSCWDTVFKGPYESGVASYKHVYFNATLNTFFMWTLTVLCIISLYECCRHLLILMLTHRCRFWFCVLFASSLPSHYYSWWVFLNYWNDDYYEQWYHQFFFSVTEMISTAVVVWFADTKRKVTPSGVTLVVGIGCLHAFAAGADQFVSNVLMGEGQLHQVARDVMFMVPDLMHVAMPLIYLHVAGRKYKNDYLRP